MQKFYFHDAASSVTGTLPGASDGSSVTPTVTATGASTNRSMNDTIGTSQIAGSLTTASQTTQQINWYRRFLSPALAAQTITAALSTWSLHIAIGESSTNAAHTFSRCVLYVWRPSTGGLVGTLWDQASTGQQSNTLAVEQAFSASLPNPAGTSVTAANGDVLVFEFYSVHSQSMASALTTTFYYDGTTEDSATSNAAYLLAPADLPLATVVTPSFPPVSRYRSNRHLIVR